MDDVNMMNGDQLLITSIQAAKQRMNTIIRQGFSLSKSFGVLGVKSNSKMDEVKRKYYELAKLYHPDVNKQPSSHQMFAEITKAYKYITENIDQHAEEHRPTPERQKQSPPRPQNAYKNEKKHKPKWQQEQYEPFHEYDDFYRHAKKFRKPKIGEDLYINASITLQQSVNGTNKEVKYTKYEPCSPCANKNFAACVSCGGKGEIYDRGRRQKMFCESCSGRGFVNECIECLGASYVLKEVTDIVYIEKGTQDKTILKLLKKGHSGFKAHNGDLYITVFVEESQHFKIDGNNIHSEIQLDFITAACGGSINAQTVYGKKEVRIQCGTQSGSIIRIFNAGLKSPFSKRMGDQIIRVKIKIPTKLSERQTQLMRELEDTQN